VYVTLLTKKYGDGPFESGAVVEAPVGDFSDTNGYLSHALLHSKTKECLGRVRMDNRYSYESLERRLRCFKY